MRIIGILAALLLVGCAAESMIPVTDRLPVVEWQPLPAFALENDIHWLEVELEGGEIIEIEGRLTEVTLQPVGDLYDLTGIGYTVAGELYWMRIPPEVVSIRVRVACSTGPPTEE